MSPTTGIFTGYAWGTQTGWIDFSPTLKTYSGGSSPTPSPSSSPGIFNPVSCSGGPCPGGTSDFSLDCGTVHLSTQFQPSSQSNVTVYNMAPPTSQNISLALGTFSNAGDLNISYSPTSCALSGTSLTPCTIPVQITLNNKSNPQPSYILPFSGTRQSDGILRSCNMGVTVDTSTVNPLSLNIDSPTAIISSNNTTYRVKSGRPFALKWNVQLDSLYGEGQYKCKAGNPDQSTLANNAGDWGPQPSVDNNGNTIIANPSGNTGSISTTGVPTDTYKFTLGCTSNIDFQQSTSTTATLNIYTSSESEF